MLPVPRNNPHNEVGPRDRSPEGNDTVTTTTSDHHEAGSFSQCNALLDKAIVAEVDKELWAALFDGDFRLAVPCDVCGRWLTAGKSKRAHRGPRCAAKAVK